MSSQAGLAFEQAPPFSLPLRFFLTAPLFLIAGGILIALHPEALASRWSPQALALTHAFTLGFLAMAMLGALSQMLPVVAGAPLPAARAVSATSHLALTLGTAALMAGFLFASPGALGAAVWLLGGGFAAFIAAAAISLARAAPSATVNGMRLALAGLACAAVLGLSLALLRADAWHPPLLAEATDAHAGFGLLGWVLLLVIGVAYQVVPMFQITPPYPPRLGRWLAGTLFVLLLLRAFLPQRAAAALLMLDAALAVGILVFAGATLRLQARRRRKLPDVTLDFWRLGMACLAACVPVWALAQAWPVWARSDAYPMLLGMLFIMGFAVSVVTGMLYKIVPFLAWFHLQAQLQAKAGTIPNMKQMISGKALRWQLYSHYLACLLLAAAAFRAEIAPAAGGLLALSAALLLYNLAAAGRRFLSHGGRIS